MGCLVEALHDRVVEETALTPPDGREIIVVHDSGLVFVNLPIIQIQNAAIRWILNFCRLKAGVGFRAILLYPIFVYFYEVFLSAGGLFTQSGN